MDQGPLTLSVLIVNWNTRERLRSCLLALRQAVMRDPWEVIVVDNASADGSAVMVATEFPEVRLIRNFDNVGYAPANNQAFAIARGEIILLLNPDTVVFPDALQQMVDFLRAAAAGGEYPDAGACTANLVFEDGTSQRYLYRFPRVSTAILRQTVLGPYFNRQLEQLSFEYEMRDYDLSRITTVPQPPGACLMVRREILDGVLFDEQFPLLYNDVDLCQRIGRAGYKIYYLPDTRIAHGWGEGGLRKLPPTHVLEHAVSLIRYFRKHGKWYAGPVIYAALVANYAFVLLRNMINCAGGDRENAWPPMNGTDAQNFKRLARLICNISYYERVKSTDRPLRRFLLQHLGADFWSG
jgi:GT2 family glycosyltransferase